MSKSLKFPELEFPFIYISLFISFCSKKKNSNSFLMIIYPISNIFIPIRIYISPLTVSFISLKISFINSSWSIVILTKSFLNSILPLTLIEIFRVFMVIIMNPLYLNIVHPISFKFSAILIQQLSVSFFSVLK